MSTPSTPLESSSLDGCAKTPEKPLDKYGLLLLVILALLVLSVDINRKFVDSQHFNLSFFSNIARNHARYGFLKTKFGQITNAGIVDPVNFVYHTKHPPLLGVYAAIAFMLFGVKPWSARITPILFAVGSIIIFYRIVERYWGKTVAFASTFVLIIMPAFSYWGRQLCYESPALFFSLLFLYGYLNWFQKKDARSYLLAVASLVIGGLTDWPVFYLPPLVSAHYLILRGRKNIKYIAWLWVFSALTFGLYVAHLQIITGNAASQTGPLLHTFLLRTNLLPGESKTSAEIIGRIKSNLILGVTSPVLTLLGFYIISITLLFRTRRDTVEWHLTEKNTLLLLLLVFGSINIIVFPEGTASHEYYIFYLLPFLALTSILGLIKIRRMLQNRKEGHVLFALLTLLILYTFLAESYGVNQYWRYRTQNYGGMNFGLLLNQHTPPDKGILLSFEIEPQGVFYADRYIIDEVDTLNKLEHALESTGVEFGNFIRHRSKRLDARLIQYLDSHYENQTYGDLIIYNIAQTAS